MVMLTFNEFQQRVIANSEYPLHGTGTTKPLAYVVMGLTRAAGELSRCTQQFLVNDSVLSPDLKKQMLTETARAMMFVAALCAELGVTLDCVAGQKTKEHR